MKRAGQLVATRSPSVRFAGLVTSAGWFVGLEVAAALVVDVIGTQVTDNGLLELARSPITRLPGSLFTTRYGVLLLAKAVCMVIVAVIATHVRRRILPRVEQRRRTTIALWCGWEVLTLSAAFGIAVVLTRASVTPF